MRKYHLLHIGLGTVGREFVRQLADIQPRLETKLQVQIRYCGFFTSRGGLVVPGGFSPMQLRQLGRSTICGQSSLQLYKRSLGLNPHGEALYPDPQSFLVQAGPDFFKNTLIIDTSTADDLCPFLEQALANGARVIVANKLPLTGPQTEFDTLSQFGPTRLRHETTVGAGLPVISTLTSLLATGDDVLEISGCMSGTLGHICSCLEAGIPLSVGVKQAQELGFTEPDPRADMSGQDVARKALILARRLGGKIELNHVATEALYSAELADLPVAEFMARLPQVDQLYAARMRQAEAHGNTLRYLARVSHSDCFVGLEEVARESSMGNLKGPDNMFIFRTRRYFDNPLIIQGPGAGPIVTAAGVMSDVLSSVGAL